MSNDIAAMGHAMARSAQYQLHAADMAFAGAVVQDARESIAAMLTERAMLRAALEKFDPSHPLLVNGELKEKIQAAGIAKFREGNHDSWSTVARAADHIQYNYQPPAGSAQLQKKLDDLESAYIQDHAEKHALREALRRVDRSHPLVRPDGERNMLVAALRKAGLLAYSTGGYDAVAETGRTFKYPEAMLWGQRESVLEEYPGEIEALEKRIAYLRNPNLQRLKIEQMQSRT